MKNKKMYLVKREVMATNIASAMVTKGKIYEISECEKQPVPIKKAGFKTK